MNEQSIELQLKESFAESQLVEKKIETALNFITNMNPVERILKTIDPQDEAIRKITLDRVQAMMNTYLEIYDIALKEGRDLPKDLLGSAADLTKKTRKKYQDENPKTS
jgi:hypothetical protein